VSNTKKLAPKKLAKIIRCEILRYAQDDRVKAQDDRVKAQDDRVKAQDDTMRRTQNDSGAQDGKKQ